MTESDTAEPRWAWHERKSLLDNPPPVCDLNDREVLCTGDTRGRLAKEMANKCNQQWAYVNASWLGKTPPPLFVRAFEDHNRDFRVEFGERNAIGEESTIHHEMVYGDSFGVCKLEWSSEDDTLRCEQEFEDARTAAISRLLRSLYGSTVPLGVVFPEISGAVTHSTIPQLAAAIEEYVHARPYRQHILRCTVPRDEFEEVGLWYSPDRGEYQYYRPKHGNIKRVTAREIAESIWLYFGLQLTEGAYHAH